MATEFIYDEAVTIRLRLSQLETIENALEFNGEFDLAGCFRELRLRKAEEIRKAHQNNEKPDDMSDGEWGWLERFFGKTGGNA